MNNNFSERLLNWFDHHGRKDLPWQQQPTPYHVWVSEIMLQQTQVATVIPYYQRFLTQFNTLDTLALASLDDVLSLWSGLGYYARGRNLHKASQIIATKYQGELPSDLQQLISLPGIGRSTAGAILSLAYHQHYPILDGNVKRVLTRYDAIKGWPGVKAIEKQLWQRAQQLLPEYRVADYIQAQMDLGSSLCSRSKPRCGDCPLNADCQAYLNGDPTAYPSAKPKRPLPLKQTHWLVVRSNKQILLQQRPQHGIWGGLWSFPQIDDKKALAVYCKQSLQADFVRVIELPAIRHLFTHFKLDIIPYQITLSAKPSLVAENNNLNWVNIDDALKLGLPAPVRTLLKKID